MQKIFRCAAQEQEESARANCPKGSVRRRIQLALPTEAREVSEFNGLEKGLGQETPIELQCVSGTAPKPLLALLSLAFPSGSSTNVRAWLSVWFLKADVTRKGGWNGKKVKISRVSNRRDSVICETAFFLKCDRSSAMHVTCLSRGR